MATEDYFAKLSPPQGPGIFVQPAAPPAMPRTDTGAAEIGLAMAKAGAVVEDIGVRWANATDQVAANLAQTQFAVKANELEHGASQDPNYFIAPDKLKAGLEEIKKEQLQMIRDPLRRATVDAALTSRIIHSVNHASNAARSRAVDAARGAADAQDQDTLSQWQRSMGDPVAQAAILATRRTGIDADVKAGIYTAHAGNERYRKIEHETSRAQVMYDTRADATGTATRLADPNNYKGLSPTERQTFIAHAEGVQLQNTSDYVRGQAQQGSAAVRTIVDMTRPPEPVEGMVTPGNVNPLDRPVVTDPDTGKPATTLSMSFERDGQEILIPRVSQAGKVMTPDQAIAEYDRTGRHLGVFSSKEAATKYGEAYSAKQQVLTNTPEGKALMSLPPHLRFRTLEGAKHDVNQLDAQAGQQAIRAAAFARDTNSVVELLKKDVDVPNPQIDKYRTLQLNACNRGNEAACKELNELDAQLELRAPVRAAWAMRPDQLGAATRALEGTLTAAGANANAAQFKGLAALKAVQAEQTRMLNEEPVGLGEKARVYRVGEINLEAAAQGDPIALAALKARGGQAQWAFQNYGGNASPWLKSTGELDSLKAQWDAAGHDQKARILDALAKTMPSNDTYRGAVEGLGGGRYATTNMRNILQRDPETAKLIVQGGVLLATDNEAKEVAGKRRNALVKEDIGGLYRPEQQAKAVELAIDLDAARRRIEGKQYDDLAGGLKKAWDDVNGPQVNLNGFKTPITPGIDSGHFTQAFGRLDAVDLLRMGGAYARDGRPLTPAEIASGAVLKATEPGSSVYFVGMRRSDPGSVDGFMGFFDIEGQPLRIDMRDVTARHPATPSLLGIPLPATTPRTAPPTPRERQIQRFDDFDQAVLGDLAKQFPNDTPAQLQEKLDEVNSKMATPGFYPTIPGFRPEAFEEAVREGYGGFGYEPTGGFIDLRRGEQHSKAGPRDIGGSGREFRELEGERKRRETKAT